MNIVASGVSRIILAPEEIRSGSRRMLPFKVTMHEWECSWTFSMNRGSNAR